jgi:putative SOS response-associated peptidase YedK
MCAHYESADERDIRTFYELPPRSEPLADYRTDRFPQQVAPIIRVNHESREHDLVLGRFGLVPHFTKEQDLKKAGRGTYNARTETVHDKPSFRTAWKFRNWCIIPARAIYEPNYESGKAESWRIERADGKLLSIAGIRWAYKHGDELIESFSMLTINADDHPLMRRFHKPGDEKRMVVMLEDDQRDRWLLASHDEARTFFAQYPAENLIARQSSGG